MNIFRKNIAKFIVLFIVITGIAFDFLVPLINRYPLIFTVLVGVALMIIVWETANPDASYADEHKRMLAGAAVRIPRPTGRQLRCHPATHYDLNRPPCRQVKM